MRPVYIPDEDDYSRRPPARKRSGGAWIIALVLFLLLGSRTIGDFFIEWEWWKEIGQADTWWSMLAYSLLPKGAVAILTLVALAASATVALRAESRSRFDRPLPGFAWGILAVLSLILAVAMVDSWTLVRFAGSRDADPGTWTDPVFGQSLSFYFFDLPAYQMLLRVVIGLVIATILVYWLAGRFTLLRNLSQRGGDIDISELRLSELLESRLIRIAGALGLIGLAGRLFLGRYALVTSEHGFMVGIDFVEQNIRLPLTWVSIALCVAAAALLFLGRLRPAVAAVPVALVLPGVVSGIVNWAYVRPNEISIQRPFIERHIAGTRAAFGLDRRTREVEFAAKIDSPVEFNRHRALLDNVRLWDWQAFHDTVTQIQGLRPYYVFNDSDVDRYFLDDGKGGKRLQQVLLTPRELDVRQLPEARTRWINPHFIYTHGYGLVMAEANRITSDGLPELFIENAPPEIKVPGLKLTRPEIYFGEAVHEPVFVRSGQPEFNYPSGSDNVQTRYEGTGGFPIAGFPMRLAAALREGDWNILLTSYLSGESRMMIRRRVADRLEAVAGFITWDEDPYLVITEQGRLVWMIDGYTTSDEHPYSRSLRTAMGRVNYIRNSVKATIDAYDGTMRLYLFDTEDPIIRAYQRLFPRLFTPASEMPADLRSHTRYPEQFFRIQAEAYRTYHMRDPEAFYNKEDIWDIARNTSSDESRSQSATPTYMVASLPGSDEPEFLLLIPFTPRGKDNLIGMMVARCDGEHLGEIVFLQLSKQELIFGPMQVKARINQDQNISKDLTLWNQQGSKVIRGQMLVLPVEKTFLYVEPIYLQAAQAPMPQLRKVAIAMGNRIAYADTYDEALRQLGNYTERISLMAASVPNSGAGLGGAAPANTPPPPRPALSSAQMDDARAKLRRYRELMSQGKFGEAGRELEALEALFK